MDGSSYHKDPTVQSTDPKGSTANIWVCDIPEQCQMFFDQVLTGQNCFDRRKESQINITWVVIM